MRLFVAIEIGEAARHAIAGEQRRLRAVAGRDGASIRWVGEAQLHLTLAFLGEVAGRLGDALVATLSQPIARPRFAAVFGGLGVFPPHGAPRALWLGLHRGAEEVVAVQGIAADRVIRVGLPLEQRPFHPHLTLGRWRSGRPGDRRRMLDADRGSAIAQIEVAALSLVRSQLSSSAPTYTVLCRSHLAEPTAPHLQSGS